MILRCAKRVCVCVRARVHRLVTRVPNVVKMKCASEETKEINSIIIFFVYFPTVNNKVGFMFFKIGTRSKCIFVELLPNSSISPIITTASNSLYFILKLLNLLE